MIELKHLSGQTVAVMGLGKSGLATLAALKASGVAALAWDDNEASRAEARKAGYELHDLDKADWSKIKSLILSPGIPHSFPAPNHVAAAAKKHGVEIIGDIELLFREKLPAKFIGITGTNGKSTTTALIAHILKHAGKQVEVGGNLGIPALSFAPLGAEGFYVIEMSSYQCELTPSAAFDVAIWLNITPDHIDRHGSLEGYIDAKKKMFRRDSSKKQMAAIGIDDAFSVAMADGMERDGAWDVTRISSAVVLPKGITAFNGILYANTSILFSYHEATTLPGQHNAQNIAAAYVACRAAGLDDKTILAGILSYPGLPHRQQQVRGLGPVRFINDSKATNADATAKALGCYNPIYWIVGGQPKEGGLNGLEGFMPRVAHAFLIGCSSNDFAAWLEGKAPAIKCGTLERAVAAAAEMAAASGKDAVVLLSPACASFDQFKNYEQRGDEFIRLVNALPATLATKVA